MIEKVNEINAYSNIGETKKKYAKTFSCNLISAKKFSFQELDLSKCKTDFNKH